MFAEKKHNKKIKSPHSLEEALQHKFQFWEKQPVPKLTENIWVDGIINIINIGIG